MDADRHSADKPGGVPLVSRSRFRSRRSMSNGRYGRACVILDLQPQSGSLHQIKEFRSALKPVGFGSGNVDDDILQRLA